jgi:hypothetical protein
MVELQGNWERRRDDRTGAFFFQRILPSSPLFQPQFRVEVADAEREREKYAETCQ